MLNVDNQRLCFIFHQVSSTSRYFAVEHVLSFQYTRGGVRLQYNNLVRVYVALQIPMSFSFFLVSVSIKQVCVYFCCIRIQNKCRECNMGSSLKDNY